MELRDVMTPNPTVCRPEDTARDAAALMRDQDIGDVLVQENGGPLGIVTERDIVTRAVATGRDPENVHLGEIATSNVRTVDVDTPVDEVIRLMSDAAVRRIPVCEGGRTLVTSSLPPRLRSPGSRDQPSGQSFGPLTPAPD